MLGDTGEQYQDDCDPLVYIFLCKFYTISNLLNRCFNSHVNEIKICSYNIACSYSHKHFNYRRLYENCFDKYSFVRYYTNNVFNQH